ncbi:MAG: diacylglycerol/polyprenol kinase family protein [Candidatus Hydrothermarchaeaceae archaeon]
MDRETRRQLIHMSGVGLAVYVKWANDTYGYPIPIVTLVLALFLGYVLTSAYKRGIEIPIVSRLIDTTERAEVIEETPGKGALSFFLGSLLAFVLFGHNINVASASIVILALGDSTSTLIGRNFGGHKIRYNYEKSWEGTLSGITFAAIGASLLLKPELAIIGAFAGMMIESLPLTVDDNIIVPLGAGAAISFALYFQS